MLYEVIEIKKHPTEDFGHDTGITLYRGNNKTRATQVAISKSKKLYEVTMYGTDDNGDIVMHKYYKNGKQTHSQFL